MLYCSQCGAANEAGLSLCARCGAPLSAVVREPAPAPDAARPVERPRGGGRPPRRSRLPLWIALGAALAVLAALLVLPRLLGGSQDPTQAAMEEIYSAAAPYQRQDGTVAPEDADAAIEAVYLSARSSNLVLSCHRDDYGVVIEVEEGPVYVYCPEIVEPDPEVILDPLLPGPVPLDPTVLDPSQPADPNTAPAQPDTPSNPDTPGESDAQSPSVPRQEGSGALRIITLQPFESSMRALAEQNGLPHDLDAPALVAWETVNRDPALWRFAEDDKRSDGDVDMEALLHLDQYQVILWHGLGGYTESTGYFLCTSIPWSEALAERYGLTEDNCCRTMDGCVALRPAFFAQHYGEGAFYNAFIYLATSYSGKDPEMARVFLDRGAAVIFVTTDDVERTYDLQMLHLVSESYLAGTEGCKTKPALDKQLRDYDVPAAEPWTIRSSLELAQITYGDQDPYLSRGARVIYYCRPGMESLPYEDWVALFDRSQGEALSPDAELTAQISRAATRFWEVWYQNDYDPATVEWMDLLEYGFSKAEREGCASYGEYFYVPLEELNRCVIRAFNLRLEPEQGVTYYPDPNNGNWYYRLEGDQVCRPGAGGEIPIKFHRLESAFRQPDGTVHLVFTRYAINTDVVWASGEVGSGLQPEEYAALSPEDFAPRLTRNEATVLGSAHMLVAPRSDAPTGIEDYYIQRCWFEPAAETAEPAEPTSPAAETLPDLTGRWLIVDAYRDIELDISNQRGNVFDLTVVNHQNGQADLSFSVSDLTMVEGEASSRYTLPNTSSSGVLTLKWDQDRLILSVDLYDVTILNEIAKHATGIYVPETNVIEKYTVRVQEVLDGGASLRVTILEPYTLDRDYVLSLQVGDWVSALNFTTQVNRIEHNENVTLYFLDNYTMIYLQDGDGILFYSMEQAVMVEREERILPVSPDFSARDYFYAMTISNHPEEGDTPVNLRTLIARYGPDLDGHQIRIAVVNGVIAEGYIGYYD